MNRPFGCSPDRSLWGRNKLAAKGVCYFACAVNKCICAVEKVLECSVISSFNKHLIMYYHSLFTAIALSVVDIIVFQVQACRGNGAVP